MRCFDFTENSPRKAATSRLSMLKQPVDHVDDSHTENLKVYLPTHTSSSNLTTKAETGPSHWLKATYSISCDMFGAKEVGFSLFMIR